MSQRNKKRDESILALKNKWEQLCLDCWVCIGCDKRCTVTTLHEPVGCIPERSDIKHNGKLAIKY